MARPEGRWVPDGRAKAILADCEASLEALDGLEIDLYLIHAPDPRTQWRTSLRALARLANEGLVRRVGVSNVNRDQLDEALELVPVAAVQVALSPYDDHALRGGVVARCVERDVAVIAHSPLGGPRRAGRLARRGGFADVAEAHGASPAEVALAWLLGLSPGVAAIPGARRPETARSAARAASIELTASERALLGSPHPTRSVPRPAASDAAVVLIMGIPGAGKSLAAEAFVARGYVRLNRDERKGSLRELAETLDEQLASGVRRVVLDNTYLTRASRSYVLDAVDRHGVPARCVWLDTSLAQAQVNLVERLLDRFGSLPTPEELREVAKREPGLHLPTTQMRTLRELEPPSSDEGFADVERVPFVRRRRSSELSGAFVAAALYECRAGSRRSSAAIGAHHTWSSTGLPTGRWMRWRRRSHASLRRSPGRSRVRSARTAAAHRAAGAGRHFLGYSSPSPVRMTSIHRARSWSAPPLHTRRSRRPSLRSTSRLACRRTTSATEPAPCCTSTRDRKRRDARRNRRPEGSAQPRKCWHAIFRTRRTSCATGRTRPRSHVSTAAFTSAATTTPG